MIVGQFSNGGLAHKKMIECICYDGGQFSIGVLVHKKRIECICCTGRPVMHKKRIEFIFNDVEPVKQWRAGSREKN